MHALRRVVASGHMAASCRAPARGACAAATPCALLPLQQQRAPRVRRCRTLAQAGAGGAGRRTPAQAAAAAKGAAVATAPQQAGASQRQQPQGQPQQQAATPFRIPAPEVQRMLAARGGTMDDLLLSLLPTAAKLARPPISNYHVGAVGLGGSGAVYFGVNLEFPGAPLSQSVHGEQFLMANLLAAGEAALHTLAISAAPCGHCRQFYSELACADSVRFLFGSHDSPKQELYSLQQLLPSRFGPLDLLEPGSAPLLLERQDNGLAWAPPAARRLAARVGGEPLFAAAAAAALEAAQRSYAPYTRCPAGVALIARGGRAFAGGYVENAAHNPGLAPFQAAVANAIIGGLGPYTEIEEVVVVELEKGLVQHAGVVRATARAATGNGRLPVTVLHAARAKA